LNTKARCFDVFLQALQETLERQGEILAYIEKKKQKKSKVTKKIT
jgi:hypothetical protein